MRLHILLFGIGVICAPKTAYTQEKEIEVEESAEVFLEEYSDDFQENFFEALKQKGIENYDKAINLLLECKRLKGNNLVIDHELAKAHLASRQYILAQEYALVIVNSEPENLWFLNTLVEILQKQGNSIDALKTQLPYDQNKFKENLALIYYGQRNYQKALKVLKEAEKTSFSEDLTLKINDSLKRTVPAKEKSAAVIKQPRENPLDRYKVKIGEGIASNNFMEVSSLSKEALESFPSQPYFYYAYGWSLNKNGKSKLAVEALQNALDYLLDDDELANKIYRELAKGHTSLGNTSKANMYLSKIKPGS
ncbi:MAG: hypothetical protein AAFO99_00160 [Bacteroidota bacterium]